MTKEEFARRVTAAQGKMYRIARGYLYNEHDGLDAVSEAILKGWQKQTTLKNEDYFETWLVRILVRECMNILRRKKRMIPVESVPETAAPTSESAAALAQAVDALPDKLRAVTVLHYMEGYAVNEIAAILHTGKGTVCSRLHYARLKLRELLKEEIE